MILQIFNCLSCFSLPLTALTFLLVLYPSSTLFACFSLMLSMCPHFFVIGIWFSCEHGSTFRRTGRLENSRWLRSRTSKSFFFNTLTSNSWTFSIIFFWFLCFFIFCHFWSLIMIISCLCIKQKIWLLTFGFFCRHQIHYFTHSRSPYLFYPIYRPSFFFLPTPLRFPQSLSLCLSLFIFLYLSLPFTVHTHSHTPILPSSSHSSLTLPVTQAIELVVKSLDIRMLRDLLRFLAEEVVSRPELIWSVVSPL